jgi:hypothetical protein
MASDSYWLNNEHVMWENIIKPCRLCGYCPYGQLVEEFPLPPIARSEAKAHYNYIVKALAKGTFDNPENKESPLMTREMAEKEISEFNKNDYPERVSPTDLKMQCGVFGHFCPAYYHAELLAEENEVTEEEIQAFNVEANAIFDKMLEGEKDNE